MNQIDRSLESRLELIKSSQRRASLSYLISVVIASSYIIAIYNSLLSWDKGFGFMKKFSDNEVTKTLQQKIIQNWVDNRMVSIDLLGLKLSASDFTLIGGFGLLIISIWFLLNVKRENSTIGTLLIESREFDLPVRKYIYNYISSNQIFSNAFNEIEAISSINQVIKFGSHKNTFINKIDEYLFYLPGVAVILSISGDLASLFFKSPFREQNLEPLYKTIFADPNSILTVVVVTTIGLFFGSMSLVLNHRTRNYEKGTKSVLAEYFDLNTSDQYVIKETQ